MLKHDPIDYAPIPLMCFALTVLFALLALIIESEAFALIAILLGAAAIIGLVVILVLDMLDEFGWI
ncbi:hypothetical protein J7J18_02625 [bacterium]|nr:hypothetical protein [bacterium]